MWVLGYVCPRSEILSSGCCNSEIQNVFQYTCETCNVNQCCSIYEYCISCCLHPDKVCITYFSNIVTKNWLNCRKMCWKQYWKKPLNKIMCCMPLFLITLSFAWPNAELIHKVFNMKTLIKIPRQSIVMVKLHPQQIL